MVLILIFALYFNGIEADCNLIDLKSRAVLSGKITMLIPTEFSSMSTEMLERKYPSKGHRPSEVYTDKNGTINIALSHTINKARPEDLPEVKKVMEAQFNRAPFTFIKSDLKDMNGSQFITLEFTSPAVDTKIYNMMAIGSLEGRLVMITFNCTETQRKEWESTGKKIINSIALKK
jgi:hypothetical protein